MIVIKALGQIGDSRAVDWLIGLLDDHSCHELAAEAFGQIGDIGSIRRLTEIAVKNRSDALLKAICNVGTTQSFRCLLNHIDDEYDSCCDIDASMQSKILRGLIEIIQRDAEDLDRDVLFRASKMPDIRVSIQKFESYEVEMEDEHGPYTYRPWYYVEENLDCSSLRELAQRELSSRG